MNAGIHVVRRRWIRREAIHLKLTAHSFEDGRFFKSGLFQPNFIGFFAILKNKQCLCNDAVGAYSFA